MPYGLRSPWHSCSLRSAVTTRLRCCWRRQTNTVAMRQPESEALALAEGRHHQKDVMRASLSAVSPLVDKRSRHEGAD